jgi:ABC-type sugar transport system substrate-binding protein
MTMPSRSLALFLRALDNRYQFLQKSNFYERAHLYGFSVSEYNAGNDAEAQQQQILECLRAPENARPRALFVNPVHESSLRGTAREAARLGLAWVSLNRSCDYVTELRREYPNVAFFCVDPDQRQVGRIQGQQFRILLPEQGNLLYIHGPASTSSARLRLAAVEAELSASSIRMVTGRGDWSEESGFEATKNWLQSHHHRNWSECIIGAQNDSMAVGAREAISQEAAASKRPELTAIRITGCDGLPGYGQRCVVEKLLSATIVIPPTTGSAVDQIAATLDSGRPSVSDISLNVMSFPALDELTSATRKEREASAGGGGRIPAPKVGSEKPAARARSTRPDRRRRTPR